MKQFIADLRRAVRNQCDRRSIRTFLIYFVATLLVIVLCVIGIIVLPNKGLPITVLLLLLLSVPASFYSDAKKLLEKQKSSDYWEDVSRRRVEYRAELNLDPTLSDEDKREMERVHFMIDEPFWT
jgi:hypothetical protein